MHARSVAIVPVLVFLVGCSIDPADRLARRVSLATGADRWEQVTSLSFTIATRAEVIKSRRTYLWNRETGTLTVVDNGKSSTIDLADTQSYLHQSWLEDSFWVLAPFQLLDRGVTRTYRGTRTLNGIDYEVLEVSLPSRHCLLYINTQNDLIEASEVCLFGTPLKSTWDVPRDFGGLIVATSHRSAVDPDVLAARHLAEKAKAAYDDAVAQVSQGQDPSGIEQLLPILTPTVSDQELLRAQGELRASATQPRRDMQHEERIERRIQQWKHLMEEQRDQARAKGKIVVLEQYRQAAEAEMARFEMLRKHQGLTIEITDIHLARR